MTGHTASIYSLAFSNESSMLVSGGADWTVRCWDVKGSGGLPGRGTTQENGLVNGTNSVQKEFGDEETIETSVFTTRFTDLVTHDIIHSCRLDLLSTFPTKRTPIITVHFTPRNLCLVSGPYLPLEMR